VLPDLVAAVAVDAGAALGIDALDAAPYRERFRLEAELLVQHLEPKVGRPNFGTAARERERVCRAGRRAAERGRPRGAITGAIVRGLVVVVVAVAGVVVDAEAPVVRHATEADFTDGRRVLRPDALHGDAVLKAILPGRGRRLRRIERGQRVVAVARDHAVAAE